jgi:hypothetical protein
LKDVLEALKGISGRLDKLESKSSGKGAATPCATSEPPQQQTSNAGPESSPILVTSESTLADAGRRLDNILNSDNFNAPKANLNSNSRDNFDPRSILTVKAKKNQSSSY